MDIDINTRGVHQTAHGLNALSKAAAAKTGHSLDTSTDVATVHPGWESSAAILRCQRSWRDHLTDLVSQVGSAATKLHKSAAAYEQADAEAERRLKQVLKDLSH